MSVPKFDAFLKPCLEVLSVENIYGKKDIIEQIQKLMNLSEEDIKEEVKSGQTTKVCDRSGWAITYLFQSGLIKREGRGKYKITSEGLNALGTGERIDEKFLERYEGYRNFKSKKKNRIKTAHLYIEDSVDINNLFKEIIKESSSEECKNFEKDCKQRIKEFLDECSVDVLKNFSGQELLEKMFLNQNSLIYELEYGKVGKIIGIKGTPADKYPIYKKKGEENWRGGKVKNHKMFSDSEAIEIAKEEFNCLLNAVDTIKKIEQENGFQNIENYKELNENLKKIHKPDSWFVKYIILCFPDLFALFVNDDMLKNLANLFNLKFYGKEEKYLNLGEISLFAEKLGISNYVFGLVADKLLKNLNEDQISKNQNDSIQYWLFSPGKDAKNWENSCINGNMTIDYDSKKIGDLRNYKEERELKLKYKEVKNREDNPKNDSLALWEFCKKMKKGDIVYAKQGTSKIIGRGIVESDYEFDKKKDNYCHVRKVKWNNLKTSIDFKDSYQKSFNKKCLTNITGYKDLILKLEKIFNIQNPTSEVNLDNPRKSYTKEDFLEEVYISKESLDTLIDLLRKNKNIILQGAPGTGKTFTAKRLAYAFMGEKDDERVKMVQFHQSYSYEDFIIGFRPKEDGNGFELKTGVFYDFCKKADEDSDNDYFFIIDEINRGNLSRIFGELFMLIENNKRGEKLDLLYRVDQDWKFNVPTNLYIIGLMNTADRSLAFLDYALRRRFAFFDMMPAFENEQFKEDCDKLGNTKLKNLINQIEQLNETIRKDLGVGFQIGHSFFCDLEKENNIDTALNRIVEYKIIPLLNEYFFDEPEKVEEWKNRLENCRG